MIRKLNLPSYTVDDQVFTRFDERQTVFGRMLMEEEAPFYGRGMYENIEGILAKNQEGYSRIEFAQVIGSWTVYDYFHGAFSWVKLSETSSVMAQPKLEKFVEDPAFLSRKIKETAKAYGANLVGICKLDYRWIYSYDREGNPIEIPEEFKHAIVVAIDMNLPSILSSPSFKACLATGIGYSKMAFCIGCLAEFIRNLGYRAIPMGNDTALSIPLAVDAGLGELGRNGLLITPEYGPNVRLCKVFTDLPLEVDSPIEFGVSHFCRSCRKCADSCEAGAIQEESEPSFDVLCPSNNRGIFRWAINHDRCYSFWIENGGDCSTCIAACPFVHSSENG